MRTTFALVAASGGSRYRDTVTVVSDPVTGVTEAAKGTPAGPTAWARNGLDTAKTLEQH